jgi:cytochrome c biogenesis protein
LGVLRKDKNEKTLLKLFEGDTIRIPDSNALIRLVKYAPQVHNFGEGAQVVLFRPNQEPRAQWVLKGTSQFSQSDDFVLSFEGGTSKEYTGLQVAKDPGVWVVWSGCGLLIFGLIVSFFFSHQRVWIRIPKGSQGEIVLAGTANKNRPGFERSFYRLVEGVRSKGNGA